MVKWPSYRDKKSRLLRKRSQETVNLTEDGTINYHTNTHSEFFDAFQTTTNTFLTSEHHELASQVSAAITAEADGSLRALATRAYDHYSRTQELLRQGNFAGYGEEVKRLESALKELRARAGK